MSVNSERGHHEEREIEKDKESFADLDANEKVPYPKQVFFILITETCEMFSYIGMRGLFATTYNFSI